MTAPRPRRAGGAPLARRTRENQRLRTRGDLLRAAARLMAAGAPAPSLEDVAAEALVSRATVYRYFPSVEALLVEAPLDAEVPRPDELFADVTTDDPAERVDLAEAALHAMVWANQRRLKRLLAHSLRAEGEPALGRDPVRQNRRLPLIEAALAPARGRLDPAAYDRLCAALALVFGIEAMVVLTDVHPQSSAAARRIKSWAVRALVRAALEEAEMQRARRRRG